MGKEDDNLRGTGADDVMGTLEPGDATATPAVSPTVASDAALPASTAAISQPASKAATAAAAAAPAPTPLAENATWDMRRSKLCRFPSKEGSAKAITDNTDGYRKRKLADSDSETDNGPPSITRDDPDDPDDLDPKVEVKIWPMGQSKEPFIIRVDHDATMGQFENQLKTQTCTKNCVLITMFGNPVVYKMKELSLIHI